MGEELSRSAIRTILGYLVGIPLNTLAWLAGPFWLALIQTVFYIFFYTLIDKAITKIKSKKVKVNEGVQGDIRLNGQTGIANTV